MKRLKMMTIDASVQNVLSFRLCPEDTGNFSITLNVINRPEIAAPDLAVVMFAGTAALIILCVNAEVTLVAVNTVGTYLTSVRFSIMTNFLFLLLI
jgi:hypothetical protein